MSLLVSINVNSSPLREVLDRLLAVTDDLSPVMSAIGMEMENRVRARFETQSDPLGVAWAPWRPATVKTYPKDGNRRLLDRFGDLLGGASHQFDSHSVTIGFNQEYAAYHEFGTRKMVSRGLLFANPDAGTLGPDDEQSIIDVVIDVLKRAID